MLIISKQPPVCPTGTCTDPSRPANQCLRHRPYHGPSYERDLVANQSRPHWGNAGGWLLSLELAAKALEIDRSRKGKDRLPTMHFQGQAVSFREYMSVRYFFWGGAAVHTLAEKWWKRGETMCLSVLAGVKKELHWNEELLHELTIKSGQRLEDTWTKAAAWTL